MLLTLMPLPTALAGLGDRERAWDRGCLEVLPRWRCLEEYEDLDPERAEVERDRPRWGEEAASESGPEAEGELDEW